MRYRLEAGHLEGVGRGGGGGCGERREGVGFLAPWLFLPRFTHLWRGVD